MMWLDAGDEDFLRSLTENHSTGKTNRVLTFYISKDSTMKTLMVSSTLFLTVILALAFGVACGYAAIFLILRTFGHKPETPKRAPATAAMATSASGR
jgi:hypothetical protein